jgi:hypothetical protein
VKKGAMNSLSLDPSDLPLLGIPLAVEAYNSHVRTYRNCIPKKALNYIAGAWQAC